ncbi:MAG: IS110 family transposase, partial [Dysgonamonadaceae bacterium]|nr:IS110 family transposase [Dysgonamonadaceae bacterium]
RQGFEELIAWTSAWRIKDLDLHFTMEATGVYYENLAYFLHDQGHPVHVVLPNQSKKYGQSLGVESKTDKIDAKISSGKSVFGILAYNKIKVDDNHATVLYCHKMFDSPDGKFSIWIRFIRIWLIITGRKKLFLLLRSIPTQRIN